MRCDFKTQEEADEGGKVPHADRRHNRTNDVESYLNHLKATRSNFVGKTVVYSVAGVGLYYSRTV